MVKLSIVWKAACLLPEPRCNGLRDGLGIIVRWRNRHVAASVQDGGVKFVPLL